MKKTNYKGKYKKLRELREQLNYSCKDMGSMLNICVSYYWQIESGTRNLYYEQAKQIAKIFNLKPDDIFYDDVN